MQYECCDGCAGKQPKKPGVVYRTRYNQTQVRCGRCGCYLRQRRGEGRLARAMKGRRAG